MARFLNIDSFTRTGSPYRARNKERHINILHIVDVCDVTPRKGKDEDGNEIEIPRVRVFMDEEVADAQHHDIDGTAAGLVATVEAMLAEERHVIAPPDPAAVVITDRGVWLPGASYVQLDKVQDPDDVRNEYLAVAPSQSTSKLVLLNKAFWCKLA